MIVLHRLTGRAWRQEGQPSQAATATAGVQAQGFSPEAKCPAPPLTDEDRGLQKFQALVLDSSYQPIRVVPWKRALRMEYQQKVRGCVCRKERAARTALDAPPGAT